MKTLMSDELDLSQLTRDEKHFAYNCFDSCLTLEIHNKIDPMHDEKSRRIYQFERLLQGPALQMMLRGIRYHPGRLREMERSLTAQINDCENWIRMLANAIWERGINPRSPAQLQELLYNYMHFPPPPIYQKGERKVSTNREALEKLRDEHLYAKPICSAVLFLRDVERKLATIRAACSSGTRFRANYNIGGTETGRWSSSKDSFGEGTNAQNITDSLRSLFISDPGRKLCYADLEQAESRVVAYVSGDSEYIAACESGDPHTHVSRLVWPELPWTGDLRRDKEIAEQPYYRHFSYRDLGKRGGHATNYYGKPYTVAKHLKVSPRIISEFQDRYFAAFPGISEWHKSVQQRLQATGVLETPLGRRRAFFGRLKADTTLREAIAFVPQSTVADILNLAMYRVWKSLDAGGEFELLGQVHDAILFQYREDRPELVSRALDLMQIPVVVNGRTMVIPVEAKVGYSWLKDDLAELGSEKERAQVPPADDEIELLLSATL